LFDYAVNGPAPENTVVWSHVPIQPLAAGALTPFSFSVMAELYSRGWYRYYDRLGFEPAPRAALMRQYQGRGYVNLSISAKLEADQAGVEPITLQFNGQLHQLAPVEKRGFFAGLKLSRKQKKIDETLTALVSEIDAVVQKVHYWHFKTNELRWSQAEILQIMEEIEQIGIDAMATYVAARHNLELAYNRLVMATKDKVPFPNNLIMINSALSDMDGLVESAMAKAVVAMSESMGNESATVHWLKQGDFAEWEEQAPHPAIAGSLITFLEQYGHRCMSEGEMSLPRWSEDPFPILRSALSCIEYHPKLPTKVPAVQSTQKLLETLDSKDQKQGKELLQRIRQLHSLQSRALHALAYVWAGTRRWALAAAREAQGDQRIHELQDIFFFELEEIKQMMTGEWNISSREQIQDTCRRRQAEYAAWQTQSAPELLVGDSPATPVQEGLPGVVGLVTGPLRRWGAHTKNNCRHAVIAAQTLDSGWSLALPVADAFVAAHGSPLDPFVAAARAWHHPAVVGLGAAFDTLVDGAQTTVDGDHATVTQ
jgi:hypothetical protein